MSQFRFTRNAAPIEFLIEVVAAQEGVSGSEVRVKTDPHPSAPDDEIVLCITDEIDHWPNATRSLPPVTGGFRG